MDPITARLLSGMLGMSPAAPFPGASNWSPAGPQPGPVSPGAMPFIGFGPSAAPPAPSLGAMGSLQTTGPALPPGMGTQPYFDQGLPALQSPFDAMGGFRYSQVPGGVTGPVSSSQKPPIGTLPASVAPTGAKADGVMRSHSASATESHQYGNTRYPYGMAPPTPFGQNPNDLANLYSWTQNNMLPITNTITSQYQPMFDQIEKSYQLGPDEQPYVSPDPMRSPMAAAASTGLGNFGAILMGHPEQGGEAANRLERGIVRHQETLDKAQQVKRDLRLRKEEAILGTMGEATKARLAAQDKAFEDALKVEFNKDQMDQQTWTELMRAKDSEEDRKVRMQIAKWELARRKGDTAAGNLADMVTQARSAISFVGAEVAKNIAKGIDPDEMDIIVPMPGSPPDPMHNVPEGYQMLHGLSSVDERLMTSLQSLPDQEARNAMVMLYTNWVSGPAARSLKAKQDKAAQNAARHKAQGEIVKATLGGKGLSETRRVPR